MPEVQEPAVEVEEPYQAFEARMNAKDGAHFEAPGYTTPTPAAGDKTTPPSVPVEAPAVEGAETGQTAGASEAAETDLEQEAAEAEAAAAAEAEAAEAAAAAEAEAAEAAAADDPNKDSRLARRMRTLTGNITGLKGTIAELQSRLDAIANDEADAEIPGEAASPPAAVVIPPVEPLKRPARPKLANFEDTDQKTAWQQLEEAEGAYDQEMEAYTDAKVARELKATIDAHKAELAQKQAEADVRVAKAAHDAAWNAAASRFPDFNEGLEKATVSTAMEYVLRMDPAIGTELVHYLKQHPEESKAIADSTLHKGPADWERALSRASMEFGKISAKLKSPEPKPAPKPAPPPPKPAAIPAPPPPPKKVTTANKPPSQIRTGGVPPKLDTSSDEGAQDYDLWERQREAEIAAQNGGRR
jgi:hypothetical protein